MDVRVWNHEDMPLTEAEYEKEVAAVTKLRKEQTGFARLSYWVMDRAYLKALRKGETTSQAHDAGIVAHSFIIGSIVGTLITLIVVGTIGWAWNLYLTARGTNLVLALAVWTAFFVFGFRKTRQWLVKLWRRLKPKPETEPQPPGPKAP